MLTICTYPKPGCMDSLATNFVEDANVAAEKPDLVDAGNRVFAGTINGGGALEIQVTRTSADSTLARVVKMVNEAETNQSPTQRTLRGIDKLQIQSPIAAKGKWRPPNVSKPLSEHGVALNNHIT